MLFLIHTHRHQFRLVQQDVRRHQRRIGKQPGIDIVGVLGALILELGHSGQFPEHGIAVQDPAQLCVCGHMTLHKQRILFGIQPAGHIQRQRLVCPLPQIRRILSYGNSVLVHHAVQTVVFVRKSIEIFDSAKVIPDGQRTGRLYTGKHHFLILEHDLCPAFFML